jgi:MFS family permease
MLKELSLTFSSYSLLTAIPLITKTLCLTNWARLLDDNKKFEGLFLAMFAIGATPILWSFNQSYPALAGLQVISGISWAGFDLVTVLLIQQMYPETVTHKLGLFLALGSLGSVVGGILGGYLLTASGSYQWVFAISGMARYVTGFLLLWYLRRHRFFRFHELKLKRGLSTIVAVRPSLTAAAKLIHFPPKKTGRGKHAA